MSLIFCGDLTLPFGINIDIEDIKPLFANHEAIANLEGSIQFDEKRLRSYKWNDKFSLYSCPKVIDIIHALNIRYVSLCNNHVLDYKHPIEETEAYLKSRNICPFGLKNHDVLVANLNGVPLYIVTFATFATEHSLHLFNPDYVIKDIQTLKKRDSNCLIAVYPHWGIEKFRYPEPADRNLAHRIIDAGADIIVSGAGLPTELPEYLKGFKTKMAPIVSSVKSAKVILKYWDRRHNVTADMIIIEGPKAGGHLGFSVEELESELDYDNEIQGIIDVVKEYEKKYNKDIPVVVAGGISDKNKVKHAFDLGAQGVQVATRFVPTKECDADENYKKEYIKAKKEDIVIVKSPVGMPGRAIKNKFMEKVINGEKFTPKKCLGCLARCNPKEIPYCITERLIYAAKGKTDEALLFCGADAYKVNKITTVKKVFKELLEEKEV